ncbi:hypothetical protein GCM10010269_37650 [Streptomyces humidus]|uniref:Uncharacterized protein n=1 Tax=Streptomyces humidus TaxID=52259 RepID=A0A918L4L1_9ACTN|nr:hypothetical protein GCM10010269_37650 [Streptomyces humidus]
MHGGAQDAFASFGGSGVHVRHGVPFLVGLGEPSAVTVRGGRPDGFQDAVLGRVAPPRARAVRDHGLTGRAVRPRPSAARRSGSSRADPAGLRRTRRTPPGERDRG